MIAQRPSCSRTKTGRRRLYCYRLNRLFSASCAVVPAFFLDIAAPPSVRRLLVVRYENGPWRADADVFRGCRLNVWLRLCDKFFLVWLMDGFFL